MNANTVVNILCATRHRDDLCVPECKDGPSMGRRSRRLDLWAMRRSYTRFATFGYEVKVSRADFKQDEKWPDYLPLCHQFFFVTPWKLVDPSEVPDQCGLIWVSKNLTRCYVKKKAAHRNIDMPETLLLYILMSRAVIDAADREDKIARLRQWARRKGELKELGLEVSRGIRTHVHTVNDRCSKLTAENESLRSIKDFWTETLGCREEELENRFGFQVKRANEAKRAALEFVSPELSRAIEDVRAVVRKAGDLVHDLDRAEETLTAIRELETSRNG